MGSHLHAAEEPAETLQALGGFRLSGVEQARRAGRTRPAWGTARLQWAMNIGRGFDRSDATSW
ncbi:hypothetical protein Misp01_52980 [Microtetraspora sp. NBRC 13810]|nr:hypothetical protein Misp01_52980 [Microtetraspora sp. NBRC 13810]